MMLRMMGGSWSNWDSAPEFMKQMMQQYYGGWRPFWAFGGLLDFATSILIIILLVVAIRWFWKKGNK